MKVRRTSIYVFRNAVLAVVLVGGTACLGEASDGPDDRLNPTDVIDQQLTGLTVLSQDEARLIMEDIQDRQVDYASEIRTRLLSMLEQNYQSSHGYNEVNLLYLLDQEHGVQVGEEVYAAATMRVDALLSVRDAGGVLDMDHWEKEVRVANMVRRQMVMNMMDYHSKALVVATLVDNSRGAVYQLGGDLALYYYSVGAYSELCDLHLGSDPLSSEWGVARHFIKILKVEHYGS